MNRRSGFTLIELTITMSAGTVMMILAIGMLHQSMTLASRAHQQMQHLRALDRLAREFRRDAHRAQGCTVGPEGVIHFSLPDQGVVTYRAAGRQITRQQPLADGRSRRESFVLTDQSSTTFESLSEPFRAVATVVHRPPGAVTTPRVDRKVSAVIGRLTQHEMGDLSP